MKLSKKIPVICLCLLLTSLLSCATQNSTAENEMTNSFDTIQSDIWANLWLEEQEWFAALRDAVFGQTLTSNEVYPIYLTAKTNAENITSEVERNIMLARCENLAACRT